ncbi:MAG: hypothetical protein IIW01_11285 [Thermoguttaceae bacterium]|nr:hypothetical protein [Thermoguttaceae bacterium]
MPTARAATAEVKWRGWETRKDETSNRVRYLHFMENIGENQGTSRKIKRFFPDVSVLSASLDALKRLGKKGGLGRLARRGGRRGSSERIRKTETREKRRIGKAGEIEKLVRSRTSFSKANATVRRRNREEDGVDERF